MSDQKWHYTRDEQQHGPVTADGLKELAASGEIRPEDLLWTEGQSQWTPASAHPELFGPAPSAAVVSAVAPAAPPKSSIGYYTAISGLPERAQATLAKHAKPIGDVGDWPLNDAHVDHFRETVAQRKKVNAAAQLYKALLALAAIVAGIMLTIAVVGLMAGGSRTRSDALAMLVPGGLFTAFAVLYFFAWRATLRSQRWAPLTMFIVFVGGIALDAFMLLFSVQGSMRSSSTFFAGVGALIGMLLPAAFAVISWKAFAAIPKYLAQPAWCQELVAAAKI